MMFNRIFHLPKTLSFFLFGARGTGKSTLLRSLFGREEVIWFDLLDIDLENRISKTPGDFTSEIDRFRSQERIRWIVIDEVQKLPQLLDLIHQEIERKRFRFALSGSSARKLKRGSANLLAGRALENFLFPLTHREIGDGFDLDFVLRWGSLPILFSIPDEGEKEKYLKTYANTYLREEIQMEQLVRKLQPFRSFLEVAAQSSGQIVNYSKIARDVGSDPVSVQSYFQILEDTYLMVRLPAFHQSIRKRQHQAPKFYLFDMGVQSALAGTLKSPGVPGTYHYGALFEQLVILEIYRLNHYLNLDYRLSYLRTKDGVEIDLIIDRPGGKTTLVEIKSTDHVKADDLRNLWSIGAGFRKADLYCFSLDPREKKIGSAVCLPWQKGIQEVLN